jgi:hypothetical protein
MRLLVAPVKNVTGYTRHYVARLEDDVPIKQSLIPPPVRIEIHDQPPDEGYLLLRFGRDGECQADTWHLTLAEAKAQARAEYDVLDEDWAECP